MKNLVRLVGSLAFKNDAAVLFQCLTRLSEFCDAIVCIDDGSSDGSHDIARQFKLVKKLIRHEVGGVWDNVRNMREISSAYKEFSPEWIMQVDPDDLVDGRFSARVDELLSQQHVCRYTFQEVTLWGSNTQYRIDKPEWYARPICYTPQLLRWDPTIKFTVGSADWRGRLISQLSRSLLVGNLKKIVRPLGARDSQYSVIRNVFFPSDRMNYTNCQFHPIKGETVNLDLKKIHYHFADISYAIKKHMNYALQTAIRQNRLEEEIPEIVDWACEKLSGAGLRLSPVRPEWQVL